MRLVVAAFACLAAVEGIDTCVSGKAKFCKKVCKSKVKKGQLFPKKCNKDKAQKTCPCCGMCAEPGASASSAGAAATLDPGTPGTDNDPAPPGGGAQGGGGSAGGSTGDSQGRPGDRPKDNDNSKVVEQADGDFVVYVDFTEAVNMETVEEDIELDADRGFSVEKFEQMIPVLDPAWDGEEDEPSRGGTNQAPELDWNAPPGEIEEIVETVEYP